MAGRLSAQSMMTCAASVAIARYRPLIRTDGSPNASPTTAVTHAASGTLNQNGMPALLTSSADANAPTPMNAPCPIEICPA